MIDRPAIDVACIDVAFAHAANAAKVILALPIFHYDSLTPKCSENARKPRSNGTAGKMAIDDAHRASCIKWESENRIAWQMAGRRNQLTVSIIIEIKEN